MKAPGILIAVPTAERLNGPSLPEKKSFPGEPGNEGIMLGFKFTDLFDDAEFTLNWTSRKNCPKIPQLEEKELPEKFRLVKRCVTLIKPAGFFLKGN